MKQCLWTGEELEPWSYKTSLNNGIAVGIFDGMCGKTKALVNVENFDAGKTFDKRIVINKELAEKYHMDLNYMVGFLDGINESLKVANPIEEMTEDTKVTLDIDLEKLYYNMVEAKADWLYELPAWDKLLTAERRKEIYREQKKSGTIVKPKKIGRNDPCPCGSGKKYKQCCGRK